MHLKYDATRPQDYHTYVVELKQKHQGKLFEGLCDVLKSGVKGNVKRQTQQLELASKRCVYR